MKIFVKELTLLIFHSPDETLYLIMSLINLYKKVKRTVPDNEPFQVRHLTNYLCEAICNLERENIICSKEIPLEKQNPDYTKIREIDLFPPVVFSEVEREACKISKITNKKHKKVDLTNPLHTFCFNSETK
jgi:hypothetical protein